MAPKSDKEGKGSKKSAPQTPKETPDKPAPKSKKPLDDEEDDEGQDESLDDLEQTPEWAFTHKSGSIGGAHSGRPWSRHTVRKLLIRMNIPTDARPARDQDQDQA